MSIGRGLIRVSGLFLLGLSFNGAAMEIQTVEVGYVQADQERVLDGLIEAVHQATVSAQTSGRVIKINYDVDDFVEKGAILLQFRDKEQRARYEGAQANYEQAEAEYRRTRDLLKQNLVSQSAMDKAEARLKATRAERDQAKENLEHTRVRAPYSGIVVKRHIEVGETARVGRKLFTGISLEQLRATVNVPEDIINVIREKKQARIIIDRHPPLSLPAKSLTISPYADPDSHTFVVRVNLPKGDYRIYPGMFSKVAFIIAKTRQLSIPVKALAHRSEVQGVYVLGDENRITFRQVRVGRHMDNGRVAILAGLSEGETIALDPIAAVVRLKEQEMESEE